MKRIKKCASKAFLFHSRGPCRMC